MSRRRAGSNPVSLFPFLAVLVSTMGALIFLLLVIAKQAQRQRDTEQQEAGGGRLEAGVIEPFAGEPLPPLPISKEFPTLPELPEEDLAPIVRSELPEFFGLTDSRLEPGQRIEELNRELQAVRQQRANLPPLEKDRLAYLSRFFDELGRRLEEIRQLKHRRDLSVVALHQQLGLVQEEKDRLEWQAEHDLNRYAVVPYTGPNGTKRRPIFLECRSRSITLQPENVTLRPEDLRWPGNPDNPLASMVRAIVTELSIDGPDGVPYPLLIVRPDGIGAYYLARRALEPVNLQFGYELLGEEIELDFPKIDPHLRSIAQSAVDEALERGMRNAERGMQRSLGPVRWARNERDAGKKGGTGGGPLGWRRGEPVAEIGSSLRHITGLFDAGPARRLLMAKEAKRTQSGDDPGRGEGGKRKGEGGRGKGEGSRQVTRNASSLQPPASSPKSPVSGRSQPSNEWGGPDGLKEASAHDGRGEDGPNLRLSTLNSRLSTLSQLTFDELLFEDRPQAKPTQSPKIPQSAFRNPHSAASFSLERQDELGRIGIPGLKIHRRALRLEVVIECRGDSLVLHPGTTHVPLGSDEDARIAVRDIYRHILDQLKKSGSPGRMYYWKPVLRFYVRPDGLENYYRMRTALLGGRFGIEKEFLDESANFEFPDW